ncbi:hypothetical protein B0H16DRAFT_1685094 [Mycena metata]|uniref:Uncharacterized protein n=1 Tax=Mycena metata TaxID=1033252 RepID=A0AAD7JWH1_9AGAR|nr:hypothetical protein B0H16DRAFT_1685094 [Mycena metata]
MAACRSFSNAEYEDVSQFFGLDSSADAPFDGWADLIIPPTLLPTTVVSDLVSQILSSHISPGNPKTLKNEASTMAFSAGPFQTLVCLFGGAMKDRPKQVLPATELSSSGRVQCEVFCEESLLLFLRELKFDVGKNLPKAVAQVLCELYAAWHLNRRFHDDIPPARLPPVRACLRDASTAYFVGYDWSALQQAYRYLDITPGRARRPCLGVLGMYGFVFYPVTESLYSAAVYQISFSILFEGYLNAVKLYGQRSLSRSQAGDPQARGSHRAVQAKLIQALPMAVSDRESTRQWKTAIEHAYKAAGYLQKAQSIRSNDAAKKGLESLQDSLQAWPTKACSPMLKQQRDEYQALIVARYESTLTEDSEMEQWSPEIPADVLSFNLDAVRRDVVENFWKVSGVATNCAHYC